MDRGCDACLVPQPLHHRRRAGRYLFRCAGNDNTGTTLKTCDKYTPVLRYGGDVECSSTMNGARYAPDWRRWSPTHLIVYGGYHQQLGTNVSSTRRNDTTRRLDHERSANPEQLPELQPAQHLRSAFRQREILTARPTNHRLRSGRPRVGPLRALRRKPILL